MRSWPPTMWSRSGPSSAAELDGASSHGETAMKCRVCRQPAVIDVPRHNANFCGPHFLDMCRRQVVKAIDDFDMLSKDDRILIAVSGGKDSLAVWDMLIDLGYSAD